MSYVKICVLNIDGSNEVLDYCVVLKKDLCA